MIIFNDGNLDESINWEFSLFDVDKIYNEECPIISKL